MKVYIRPAITGSGVRYYVAKRSLFGFRALSIHRKWVYKDNLYTNLFKTPRAARAHIDYTFGEDCDIRTTYL